MNANCIVGYRSGTTKNFMPLQAIASATETALVVNTDTGTTAAFLALPVSTSVVGSNTSLSPNANPAILNSGLGREYGAAAGSNRPYYKSTSFDGRAFKVRLQGVGNAGANAAQSVLFNLYQGTNPTIASNRLIATTGAALAAVAGGPFQFLLEATLLWDAASGILSGSQTGTIAFGSTQQYTVPKAIANVGTAVTLANLSFLPTVTFGNAAASTVQVRDFAIEEI